MCKRGKGILLFDLDEILTDQGKTIIPFDPLGEDAFDPELLDYLAQTIVKSFRLQERFDMTAQDKLPWRLIDSACKDKQTCDTRLIWKIGRGTDTDGVICGHIKRWLNGVEIKAEFREIEALEVVV